MNFVVYNSQPKLKYLPYFFFARTTHFFEEKAAKVV